MDKYTKLFKQVLLFGLVGGISFLIDLTVTTALYDLLRFPAYLAGGIGFLSAFFFNFPINRKHVFNHSKYDRFTMKRQVIMYISLSLFNLAATAIMMQLIVGSGLLNIGMAKVCTTTIIAAWNFAIFRFFIFSKRPNQAESESLIIQ